MRRSAVTLRLGDEVIVRRPLAVPYRALVTKANFTHAQVTPQHDPSVYSTFRVNGLSDTVEDVVTHVNGVEIVDGPATLRRSDARLKLGDNVTLSGPSFNSLPAKVVEHRADSTVGEFFTVTDGFGPGPFHLTARGLPHSPGYRVQATHVNGVEIVDEPVPQVARCLEVTMAGRKIGELPLRLVSEVEGDARFEIDTSGLDALVAKAATDILAPVPLRSEGLRSLADSFPNVPSLESVGLASPVDWDADAVVAGFGSYSNSAVAEPSVTHRMACAMREFVTRVEAGQVRSRYTYEKFKRLLAEYDAV